MTENSRHSFIPQPKRTSSRLRSFRLQDCRLPPKITAWGHKSGRQHFRPRPSRPRRQTGRDAFLELGRPSLLREILPCSTTGRGQRPATAGNSVARPWDRFLEALRVPGARNLPPYSGPRPPQQEPEMLAAGRAGPNPEVWRWAASWRRWRDLLVGSPLASKELGRSPLRACFLYQAVLTGGRRPIPLRFLGEMVSRSVVCWAPGPGQARTSPPLQEP